MQQPRFLSSWQRMRGAFLAAATLMTLLTGYEAAAVSQQEPAATVGKTASASSPDSPPPNLAPLEAAANNWLKRPELAHSLVGLEVMHIPSGHVLFSFNGRRRFVPASTTKVFTTACAMDLLGADYKFKTRLKGYGHINGNRLDGSLYIEPSQDPTLKTADLRELLSAVTAKNVKTIEGKFDVVATPGGGDTFTTCWLAEDWGQDWMPVPSDFVLDDNLARRDPARGYKMVTVGSSPGGNALVNSLLKGATGPSWVCFDPKNSQMEFWRPDGALTGGQVVGNPMQYNLAAARSQLKLLGVKVKDREDYTKALPLEPSISAEHYSKPLSEIVKHCLKESDNLYAQQLLRTLGTMPPVYKGLEKASLEERGLARVRDWTAQLGVPADDLVLFDGCGLSRKNCFTPHALNLVHRHMATSQSRAYLDVMPLDGAPGTTNGSFRYKTGAMDSVRSISGIVVTSAGEPLAVTVMINAHSQSVRELRASIGSLIDQLQTLGSMRFAPEAPAVPPAVQQRALPGGAIKTQPLPRRHRGKRSRHH